MGIWEEKELLYFKTPSSSWIAIDNDVAATSTAPIRLIHTWAVRSLDGHVIISMFIHQW